MCHEGGLQDRQLPFESLSSLGRGDELVRRAPGPEVVSEFVEGTTEAFRGSKAFETQHRVVALFEATVVSLNGLITNDKFCLSLVSSQKLGWVRGPRVGVGGRTDPANHPEGVRPPSGGEHATKVAGSTSLATEVGCGAAVGSSLPTSPGVDSQRGAQRRFPAGALTPTKGEDQ